eukprot:s1511_g16.t1
MTRSQEEERELELERNARLADLEVVLSKLDRDTQALEQRLSAAGSEAERHAKDVQYLRQRQKMPVDDTYQGAVAGFLQFALIGFDATVWPANANVVVNSMNVVAQLLGMSSSHMAWIQYPVLHAATNLNAMVKHRHLLEISMLKHAIACQYNVQILYAKPDARANDNRNLSQPALCGLHSNYQESPLRSSRAVQAGTAGPCPLIKVTDFINYDESTKPGPAMRCEQMLGCQLVSISIFQVVVCVKALI